MSAEALSKIYHDPKNPGSLGGVERLLQRARQLHVPGVSRKTVQEFLLRRQLDTEDEPSNFVPDAEKDKQDLYDVITKVTVFIRTWEVDRGAKIPRGNYDISTIL